jgi:rhodanese-related sulfurtransferase
VTTAIERDQVRQLLAEGAQLVEVLPAAEYEEDHLPGARNIPLSKINRESAATLDERRPVIVYCWDSA